MNGNNFKRVRKRNEIADSLPFEPELASGPTRKLLWSSEDYTISEVWGKVFWLYHYITWSFGILLWFGVNAKAITMLHSLLTPIISWSPGLTSLTRIPNEWMFAQTYIAFCFLVCAVLITVYAFAFLKFEKLHLERAPLWRARIMLALLLAMMVGLLWLRSYLPESYNPDFQAELAGDHLFRAAMGGHIGIIFAQNFLLIGIQYGLALLLLGACIHIKPKE